MAKDKTATPNTPADTAVQTPALDEAAVMAIVTGDEHAGRGGSYTLDPATGQRTRNPDAE